MLSLLHSTSTCYRTQCPWYCALIAEFTAELWTVRNNVR